MNNRIRQSFQDSKIFNVKAWISLGLFALLVVPVTDWAVTGWLSVYENSKPVTAYLHYESLEPVQAAYKKCEDLQMLSYMDRKIAELVSWTDTLKCDLGNGQGFGPISTQEWPPSILDLGDYTKVGYPWTYTGERPLTNALCYFRSTACVHPRFGDDKCLYVTSERFRLNGTIEDCN